MARGDGYVNRQVCLNNMEQRELGLRRRDSAPFRDNCEARDALADAYGRGSSCDPLSPLGYVGGRRVI